jgi:hypothetical protein
MKFVKLKSHGGDYLVVAENVAWLRAAENDQTKVGCHRRVPAPRRWQHRRDSRRDIGGVNRRIQPIEVRPNTADSERRGIIIQCMG